MIYYLAHDHHRYTINSFLAGWKRDTASRFAVIGYREFFRRSSLPAGAYIFTDIERLTPGQLEKAARAWQALENSGLNIQLLNHPLRVMRRYELLRTLYHAGINDFNIYRLTDCCRPERFPVFIRGENDHSGPETPLLRNQAELDNTIEGMLKAGRSREGRIIVEYCAEPTNEGNYKKYGAFVVLGEILPKHVMFSSSWMGKRHLSILDKDKAREEAVYMNKNPHASQLKIVSQLAHVDYGRIDYGIVNGRLQIYEINTNPSVGRLDIPTDPDRGPQQKRFSRRFMQCLLAVDSGTSGATAIPVGFDPHPVYWRYRHLPYQAVSVVAKIPFLRRFEPWLYWYVTKWAKKVANTEVRRQP